VADEQDRLTEVNWPFTRKLVKAIPGKDGDDTNSLELREPTLGDMLEFGVLDGDINGDRMVNLIAKLSEVSKAAIKVMHPKDYFAIQKVVTGFFTEAMR
jgi:hypothetical protein